MAEHQHRIQRVVNEGHVGRFIGHHSPTINQKYDSLTLIVLIILDDQLVVSRGTTPIDISVMVIAGIFAESFKFVVLPDLSSSTDAQ